MTQSETALSPYTRSSPYLAKIKERVLLNPISPHKKTFHISLSTPKGALSFLPGDSLGILPDNDPSLVTSILSALGQNPDTPLIDPRSSLVMRAEEFFTKKVNLSRISSSLLSYLLLHTKYAKHRATLSLLLQPVNKAKLQEFVQGKDLLDLFLTFPIVPRPLNELCPLLAPLLPRFYSISSSSKVHPEEVHILVALSSHIQRGKVHFGVASHFLCHLVEESSSIPVYVQPSVHFRLPIDPNTNIIMVGPGTGVAPFRAFLQERSLQEGSGKNWLFFGGRHRSHDFFYEDYWTALCGQERLRLSTAFSRDQEEKYYVQHKLWEERKLVFQWLDEGATFYICGDALFMAKDVESTLLAILQNEGSLTEDAAKRRLQELRQAKRYLTDIY